MLKEELLIELIGLTSKYTQSKTDVKVYFEYVKHSAKYLFGADFNDAIFDDKLRNLLFVERKNISTSVPVSVSDSVRMLSVIKKLQNVVDNKKHHLLPIFILKQIENEDDLRADFVQILNSLLALLKIPTYVLGNLVEIMHGFSVENNTSHQLIISGYEIDLHRQVIGHEHLILKGVTGEVKFSPANNNLFFVKTTQKDMVLIDHVPIQPDLVYLVDANSSIQINALALTYADIVNNYTIHQKLPRVYAEATELTPKISLNADNGFMEILGKSYPEDPWVFYKPLLNWLDKFILTNPPKAVIAFQLDYFNTMSSKLILEILRRFEILHEQGCNVSVDWYYSENDDDLLEAGETYAEIVNAPFKMLVKNEIFKLN
jgi:hypothetical protein